MNRSPLSCRSAVSAFLTISMVGLFAADWPCYKGDAARSSVTDEKLSFPLTETWVHHSSRPPKPAWPEPARELHRIDFDYAFQPVAAGGLVYVGSSADDTLRALDAKTGRVRWSFTAEGPIRFAPHIDGRKCYLASDDGWVYCLASDTGRHQWSFRAAPNDRQFVGDGRVISRWPCRSGVLVSDGIAYVVAGMWPSEGIYIYALDARTGKTRWVNDTSGAQYMAYPHGGAYALGGVAPQGYLLASKDVLLVPTGRGIPAAFDRRTGKFLYFHSAVNKHNGGCWASISGNLFFNQSHARGVDEHIRIGRSGPRAGDGMLAFDIAEGKRLWGIGNRQRVVADSNTLFALGGGVAEALELKEGVKGELKWSTPHGHAWSAARSSNAFLIGGEAGVTALSTADGKALWSAKTDGPVRGIAIAGGRVIASTEKGTLYCFSNGATVAAEKPKLPPQPAADPEFDSKVADVLSRIGNTNFTKGYALVAGESDARLAEAIAKSTDLHVVCVLPDEAAAASERKRLIDRGEYGERVAIHTNESAKDLPYSQYFANVVVVSGKVASPSGAELYRVLRPCGGLMTFTDMERPQIEKKLASAGIPDPEKISSGGLIEVSRGKLPGAFDWDSNVTSDKRVKWPLELLWSGGPGPSRMVNRHWRPATPIAANGRSFVIGEYHIIATDSYNGAELWSREIGNIFATRTKISADDNSVYLNFPNRCLELDAQTGKIKKVYGKANPAQGHSLLQPSNHSLKIDETHSGSVTIEKTDASLRLTLSTVDPQVMERDVWSLNFDFRPASKRSSVYGPGAFQGTISIAPKAHPGIPLWMTGVGPKHPKPVLAPVKTEGGTRIIVDFDWNEIKSLTGDMPGDFSMAITLVSHDGDQAAMAQAHLFANGFAGMINQGWGVFSLNESAAEPANAKVAYGKLEDLPAHAREWGRQPKREPDESLQTRTRPLTNKSGNRIYKRAYGCGGIISSATMDFFRSGTIGFYDLSEDSGLRNFSGIRAGCGVTMIPAAGVLVSAESSAGCSCSYSFQTTFALAPASKKKNEDWAVFFDKPQYGFIQSATLNLGAPGDRRDDEGKPWLGIPRPQSNMNVPASRRVDLHVPFSFSAEDGFGPYRSSADRIKIEGTDRPWIYTSGIRGIQKATLGLEYLESGPVALPTKTPPKLDGKLDDACWDSSEAITLDDRKARIFLRHDEENLYLSYIQQAPVDRKGTATEWKSATTGKDAPIWEDDSFEMFLTDATLRRCLHLGVSSSGASYDAAWTYSAPSFPTLDIPRLEGIKIDGNLSDWKDRGMAVKSLTGLERKMRAAENFDPSFRVGWNDEGVLLLFEVMDDKIHEADKPNLLWKGDCIELLVSQGKNFREFFQMASGTGADPIFKKTRKFFWDSRKATRGSPLEAETAGSKTDGGYLVELLLPFKNLKLSPTVGEEVGLQVFVNDMDASGGYPAGWFRTLLHPGGHAGFQDRNAFIRLRLAEKASTPLVYERNEVADKKGLFTAKPPFPFPFTAPSLGANGEDTKFECSWEFAVKAADEETQDAPAFTVEAAIPWKGLTEKGFKKDSLVVNFRSRGPLKAAPQTGGAYERLSFATGKEIPPKPFTVRLHFAELDDVKPGTRIFDVKLQGKTVLENFDVIASAKGRNQALVKEFKDVIATRAISVEMVPKVKELTDSTAPILSGIEVVEKK